MNKEELKKEAEDFFKRFYRVFDDELEHAKENNDKGVINTIKMLVEFAEETTKELETQNKRLEADCDAYNYSQRTYQEEIKELKIRIEKMKCCVVSCCEGCERLPKLYKEFENENN